MGTSKTIPINLEVTASLEGMGKVISELQRGITQGTTKLDLTKGLGASLSKEIASFEKDYARIQKLTAGGVLQLGDTKEFTKKSEHMLSTFEEIQRVIRNLDTLTVLDAKKLFPAAFDERVESLKSTLGGLTDSFDKLATKNINKSKLESDIAALETSVKELNELASKETEYKLSSEQAKKRLEETSQKVEELRSKLKQEIELKISTNSTAIKTAEEELEKLLKNRKKRESTKDIVDKPGNKLRYKGKTAAQWAGDTKVDGRQRAGALKALATYEAEKKAIEDLQEKLRQLKAERDNLASASEKTDSKMGKAAQESGAKNVKEVNDALEEQRKAAERAETAAKNLAKAQEAVGKAGAKQEELTQKQERLRKVMGEIEALSKKVNFDSINKAFSDLNTALTAAGKDGLNLDLTPDMLKSEEGIKKIRAALDQLDAEDLDKLKSELKELGLNADKTKDNVEGLRVGIDGVGDTAKTMNAAQRDMERLKDSMLHFFSLSNTIQLFKRTIRDAFNTVKELDAAMTETAVVTDFSVGDMWDKLPEYSDEANKLGASIKDLYNATTLYYQQGLKGAEVMDVGVETMKMARIAGMDAAAATEAMTAALRGFNMEINEMSATRINDVYSELAAITAADTSQIATAMTKTASIAASANMEFETTAALLAQIIETTQEAPETAGTAMKTIIARFTEVKELFDEGMLTGEDAEGEEININKIDAALKTVGISLKDFLNGSKGIDDIFLELASKWDTLDLATQRYIATTAAGSRQQSRFLAMMSNYDRTMELVAAANNSAGASQKQFDKTTESLAAKLQRLKNAWDTFTMGLANSDLIKGAVDLLTGLLTAINNLTDIGDGKLGGFITTIVRLGTVLLGLKAGSSALTGFLKFLDRAGVAKVLGLNMDDVGKIDLFGALFKSKKQTEGVQTMISSLKDPALKGGNLKGLSAIFGKVSASASSAASAVGSFIAAWGPWIVLAIAIAAAIYGIIKAWEAASDAFKLEKLNESIEQMTSNIEGAKQAIDELKDSKSTLKSLQNEFSNLAQGTQEWKEKLIETNGQVLDLLDKYPELSSYITRTEFGSLDIKEEGWDALIAAQEKTLYNSTNAKIGMQYMRSDLQEKMDYEELLTSTIGENFGETIDGESVGSVIGTTAGGIIGQALGGPYGALGMGQAGMVLGAQWGANNEKAIQGVFAEAAEWGTQAMLDVAGFLDTGWGKVIASSLGGLPVTIGIAVNDALNGEDGLEDQAQRALGNGFTQNEISEILVALADAGITYDGESFSADQATIQSVLDGLEFEASFEQLTALADKLGISFSELTVSAQKYSLAKEGQRDGLMASAISNSSIANKVYAEAVGNILGETVYENIEPMLDTKESGLQGKSKKELKELYAKEVGGFYENGKLYSDATMATEWDLSKDTMKSAIASAQVAKDMGVSAKAMAETLDQLSTNEKQLFSELFSSDGSRISDQTYIDLLRDGSAAGVNGAVTGDWLAQQMGFESMSVMAEKLGISVAEVGEILATNLNAARTRITNARKATVGSMKKYGNKADSYDKHAQDLARMEETYGPEFNNYLTNLFDKVTRANDDALTSGVFSEFMEIAKSGDSSLLAEANSLINDIDWSNPIQAVSELQKKVETGTKEVQEMASAILKAGENAFSSGKQMQYFVQSESFEGVRESIQDIIETEGEISASNILEMADECSDLKKILDQTKISSAGLAKALTGLETGELTVNQLTDAVMASLKSFNSLDSLVAEISKTLEDFDLGVDENIISDTISSWHDVVKENMEKGAVGNSQIDSIMDFMLGKDWDKNPIDGSYYSEDVTYGQMDMMNNWLKNNSEDTYYSWKQMAEGKDIHGDKLGDLGGLTIGKNADGSIALNGFEGMTSEQVAQRIAAAYGVTDEAGKMLLTDFKNYSLNLARELNANDFETAFKDSLGELNTITQINSHNEDMTRIGGNYKKVIDESEIRAIAEMYGQNFDEVLQRYKDAKVQITDFYDDDGNVLSGDKLIAELDRVFTPETGRENGTNWYAGFTKKVNGKTIIDYDGMMEQLGKLNLPESAKIAMTTDIVESIREGTAEGGSVFIDYEFSDGQVRPIEIPAGIDVATAIANAEQDLKNEKLGEAIAAAFGNVEVSVSTDESNLNTEVTLKIETAVKAADTTITPKVSSDSTSQITSDVAGAIRSGSTSATASVYANTAPLEAEVANLELTVYANVVTRGGATPGGDGSDGTGPKPVLRDAEGVKNSSVNRVAFIAEEGPEIHQTADGAYLASTPQFANVEKGDTIYTAEETKKILKTSSTKIPRYADGFKPGWGYGGSGGASTSKDDEDVWENPYDKLYNLVREIDEELRRRERLERRYEKLLESVDLTADKLFDNAVEQLKQLEKEKLLNKELQEARRSQIQQYQQENADLMKYAKVVQNERGEDVLRIHWDQINLVEDPEQGQRIEDYISQLEEWFDSLEEAEDKLNDIEDRIEEVKELGKEEYLDFENAVKDAITFAYQEEIDKLSEINESINDTNTQLIDAISKQVNRIRQQRENERTEQELQEKQRQLLYLSQDTSGANDMAILELQREIEEGTVDYTDTLIDQKIDELQTQNDEAAQQREQQITLMQAQLDHLIQSGEIWDEVYSLMDEGLDPEAGLIRGSRLEQILKNAENFNGMSKVQQMEWLKELEQQAAQAVTYMRLTTEKLDTSIELDRQQHFNEVTPEPEYNGGSSSSGSSGGGGSYSGSNGIPNKPAATEGEVKTWKITTKDGGNYITTYTGTEEQVKANFPDSGYRREEVTPTNSNQTNKTNSNNTNNNSNNTNTTPPKKKTKVRVTYGDDTVVTYDLNSPGLEDTIAYWEKQYGPVKERYEYKRGGLVDFTGPAWLDGTKARPEMVLNQKDTQNFIQLKDILASIMERGSTSNNSTENNGDITYDIDINVESIGSDYDVEQVANKVKSLINEDARYRNNNAVSLKR